MDVHKAAAWASIGNFLLGCAMLYLMLQQQQSATNTGIKPTSLIPPMMWIFLGGMIIAGLLHAVPAMIQFRWRHPVRPSLHKPESVEKDAGQEVASYLVGLFKQNIAIQAKKLIASYIGRTLEISGSLDQIMSGGAQAVQLTFEKAEPRVFMYFDEKWVGRLSTLRRGQRLTVRGHICDVDLLSVRLRDCELIES